MNTPILRRRTAYESPADARIITSDGRSIPAHCSILASASPVLENLLFRPTKRRWSPNEQRTIFIPGIPCEAIEVFLLFLYSPRCMNEDTGKQELEKYGMHLLVLSHAYHVQWLKQAVATALAARLTAEVVVDVLQLARRCDVPRLYLRCMKWIAKDFAAVEQTEAWRFVQAHDSWLELEILKFLQNVDLRQNHRRKKKWEQGLYLQLGEAMDCLAHICTEGCTDVGPHDKEPPKKSKGPCGSFKTCQSLQLLFRHFSICNRKQGCTRCKWMWQLLRLHSFVCVQLDHCKVPLCGQFRPSSQQTNEKGDDMKWMTLAQKVASVKVVSELISRKRYRALDAERSKSMELAEDGNTHMLEQGLRSMEHGGGSWNGLKEKRKLIPSDSSYALA